MAERTGDTAQSDKPNGSSDDIPVGANSVRVYGTTYSLEELEVECNRVSPKRIEINVGKRRPNGKLRNEVFVGLDNDTEVTDLAIVLSELDEEEWLNTYESPGGDKSGTASRQGNTFTVVGQGERPLTGELHDFEFHVTCPEGTT